jgi:tetratricopeptide (TPR) repeat protein
MMTLKAFPPSAYTRRGLELCAAEYYAHIRKPESEWKTIADLAPQLAEFEHLVKAGDCDAACRVLDSIDATNLFLWGYYALLEGMREALVGEIQSLALQLNNFEGIANALRALGELQSAIARYEQGLALARHIRDRSREGKLQGNLGSAYWALGQYEKGLASYESALALAIETGDRWEECKQLSRLGRTSYQLGYFAEAIVYHEKALTIAREIKNRQWEGYISGALGNIRRALGQFEVAHTLYETALAIAREMGERREEGVRYRSLGRLYHDLGHPEKALTFYKVALQFSRDTAARVEEQKVLGNIGDIYLDLEDYSQAIDYYQKALTISRETGYRRGLGYRLLGLLKARLAIGDFAEVQHLKSVALSSKILEVDYHIQLILGIACLSQNTMKASEHIAGAISQSRGLLAKSRGLYAPQYALATALVGQAVCDSRWLDPNQRADLLAPAVAEYRCALAITAAPGVVREALRDLELIRAAGIEGLEPVFTLLEQAIDDWQPLSGDALPSPINLQEDTL